ncbi:hypothetical protein KM043_005587 [Ampulex compressa]|nr:hypothetical protein KM043_005587 [Ampulex compressa]
MLTLFKKRDILYSNLRYLAASFGNRKLQTAVQRSRMKTLAVCKVNPNAGVQSRHNSGSGTDQSVHLPPLMNVPSFKMSFWDLIMTRFIIQPRIKKYIHDFDMDEFLQAANHAVVIISKALGNKDYQALKGLVADCIIGELKHNIDQLSDLQRRLIPVVTDSFWWTLRVSIILPEESLEDLIQYNVKIKLGFLHLSDVFEVLKGPWIATIVNHQSF